MLAVSNTLVISLVCAALFWIVAWHLDAALRMAWTWWTSDTFAHGLIIYPVSAWLIWRKRAELRALPIAPNYWALLPMLLAGFAFVLGELAGVEAARQFGLVAMLPMAVWTILGSRMTWAIAFPLAFTALAVPVGEFLLPIMMEHTADFTVGALRMSGIPVYREGLHFTVPSGQWSVVEACSGLRYLIASVTLGVLYAYLSYTTLWRRALFVFASVAVPIVANWVRAYLIVMTGHLSGMKYAVGADHLVYGWVFFGLVMLLLFWVGSWWREEPRADKVSAAAGPTEANRVKGNVVFGVLGVILVSIAGPLFVERAESREGASSRVIDAPEPTDSWILADSRIPQFRPHFRNARAVVQRTYEKDGRQVAVFIGYYAGQREGAELIAFGNELVTSDDRLWRKVAQKVRPLPGGNVSVRETAIRSNQAQLVVWQWYWVNGKHSVSDEEVKILQALDRLQGRGDDAAVVVVFTSSTASAAAILEDFVNGMGQSVAAALQRARSTAASSHAQ